MPLLASTLTTVLALSTFSFFASYLIPCNPRTNTTQQALFDLARPQPVTYDFKSLYPDIKITVPPGSHWHSDEHFHETLEACASVYILSGRWVITGHGAGTTTCNAGFEKDQKPLRYLTWFKNYPESQSASLRLKAPVQIYHTICSVSQDAELYFRLCATPLWLRSAYFGTYLVPFVGTRMREWMIETALWYQLRVIYASNDFWTYEWEIPFTEFYIWPPEWARRWQVESWYGISRAVVYSASCFGRWMMRMKEGYEEYEVSEHLSRIRNITM
jgi:hypothetical protein